MKVPVPPLYSGTVTKYVFVESYKTTPDDLAARAYEISQGVMVKETCFGLQLTGREDEVEQVITHIRELDPAHIFVKDRGFPPGDHRRCRANLGGARPGYYGHEFEMGLIRWITNGIEELDSATGSETRQDEPVLPSREDMKLDIKKLQELINAEVP